jgi:hypothetical protein
MKIAKQFWLPLFLVLLGQNSAHAVEPLTAEQLKLHCITDVVDDNSDACAIYVVGFLDGAIATDERVAENVARELEGEESFSERAIRTRVSNRLRRSGPTAYAEFCVGSPVPTAEVIMHVIEELKGRSTLAGVSASNILYAALSEHYPCDSPLD